MILKQYITDIGDNSFKYFDIYSTYHMFYRYIESHIHIFMGPNITRKKNLLLTSINPLVFLDITL